MLVNYLEHAGFSTEFNTSFSQFVKYNRNVVQLGYKNIKYLMLYEQLYKIVFNCPFSKYNKDFLSRFGSQINRATIVKNQSNILEIHKDMDEFQLTSERT